MNIIREFMKTGEESYGSDPRGRVLLPVGAVLLPRMVRLSGRLLPVLCLAWLFLCGCVREETFRGHRPGDRIDFGVSTGYDNAPGTKAPECGEAPAAGSESAASGDVFCGFPEGMTASAVGDDMAGNGADGRVGSPETVAEGGGLPETRTAYSGQDFTIGSSGKWERIDWVDGDLFTVYCSAAQGTLKKADYTVVSHSASGERSLAAIAPVAENGLQWGTGEHVFYAMYPAAGTPGVDPSKVSLNGNVMRGTIPAVQTVTLKSGTRTYLPDMRYAYLYAATTVPSTEVPGPVDLRFKPMMTALEFTVDSGEDPTLSLYRFELVSSAVALTGDFTATVTSASGESAACSYSVPSRTEANSRITVDFGGAAHPTVITKGQPIAFTVLALPQTLRGLTAKFVTSQGTKTLALSTNGGTSVDFTFCRKSRITIGVPKYESKLTVTAPAEFIYAGGSNTYTVTSYAAVVSGGTEISTIPRSWTTEFSEDGGSTWSSTKPAWLTAFTESGAGGTSSTYTATVAAQVNSAPANLHNEVLRNAAPVNDGTNANIYDLSTHDYQGNTAPMRTANCYIVNAAGRYKLPLVYGNAVDYVKVPGGPNPGRNTSAYTSTATPSSYILSPFINHRGAGITDPYIYNNTGCVPASCTLVWQDAQNLVTNVALSSDGHFLEFTVGQATIHQGNAVVAVRDASNTVLWSWHIWVTDYRPGTTGTTTPDKEITNHQGVQYKLMTVNLGWCDGQEKLYAERTVQVRFKQTGTNVTQTITVKQKALHIAIGDNPYYQWGRKDPFVGALETINGRLENKIWYDASGTPHINEWLATSYFPYYDACITSCIVNPGIFNDRFYMDYKYYNLWSANNNVNYPPSDTPVVKTIYDPCPAGYKMPQSKAFTGFTTTGQYTSNSSEFNVQGPWNKGWNFYCGLNHTGDTVFFPASGERSGITSSPYLMGIFGYYWTAGSMGKSGTEYLFQPIGGWNLLFCANRMDPMNYDITTRNEGLSVRAAQEE